MVTMTKEGGAPLLQISFVILFILGSVITVKLNRNGENAINPERKTGTNNGFRKRDWLKISQAPPPVVNTGLGDRLELECEVMGSPPPSIQWVRGSNSAKQAQMYESNHILDLSATGLAKAKSRLIIDCVMPQYEGLYSCLATAGGKSTLAEPTMVFIQGNHVNNLTALLTACPTPNQDITVVPRIVQWNPVTMANIGNDVTLPCQVNGNPQPSIDWLDGDNELVAENNSRFKIMPDGSLLILKIRWSDMGAYTCVASNQRGRDTSESFLYPLLKES